MSRFRKVVTAFLFVICGPRLSSAAGVTVEWDPPSDGITTGFVLLYGTATRSYSQQVNVGGATSYTVNGLSAGTTYYFAVRAYDATGVLSDPSTEVVGTTLPAVRPVVTALSLSSGVSSPQVVGTIVSWRSTATGGLAPYQFQWTLYEAGQWTVGPWTVASTWTWTPSKPGYYYVGVAVRSSGNISPSGELVQWAPFTVTAPPVASVNLWAYAVSPQLVGSTILWSVGASGGTAPYQYRWWVFDGRVWRDMTGWTTISRWSWMPTMANDGSIVGVWVRSAGNAIDAPEASGSVPFPINSATKQGLQSPK